MDTTYWVDAAPFRRHVRHLIEATGLSWRLVAAHADVAPRTIRTLLHGRPHTGQPVNRIHIDTARALMSLDVDDLTAAEDHRTCAADPRTLFHTLLTLGHDHAQLTRWLTVDDLQVLSNRSELWCSAGTRARVQACHDQLTQPPQPSAALRPSARQAHLTQRVAVPADPDQQASAAVAQGPVHTSAS